MSVLDTIRKQARELPREITLPESTDTRILQAASRIAEQALANVTLVGNQESIKQLAVSESLDLSGLEVVDPEASETLDAYTHELFTLRQHKGMTYERSRAELLNPLTFAAMMVRNGDAHGCVAGAATSTADVVRTALQVIGVKPDSKLVSSFFIMEHDNDHAVLPGASVFADCALVIDPDADQLAEIAIATSDSAASLLGLNPTVALLSFSTAGSASHPLVDKVREAGDIVSSRRPDIDLIAEVQFDAAVVPDILRKKAPGSKVQGPANVFVFPDLQSANIGYKIAQRLAGTRAVGPILQGLNKPVNDLSRGCSIEDIVQLVSVTAVQSQQEQ